MTFEEAKAKLKDGYITAGIELADEHARELYFRYHDEVYAILEPEIQEYADCQPQLSTFETKPVECSLCGPNYREQLVRPLDPNRTRFIFILDNREHIFGDPTSGQPYVKVAQATNVFVNYFRFEQNFLTMFKERLGCAFVPRADRDGPKQLKQYIQRQPTIQVYNVAESSIASAMRRSSELIESCLFGLSYAKNLPLRTLDVWPIRQRFPSRKQFEFDERPTGSNLPLPTVSYVSDIVRFYQLGMSSDIPVLQFLAFYQVLEYFFVAVSDENLYAKLSSRLNDFKFRTSPTQLDRLIQDVLEHSRTTDEVEMLKNVLNKYVDEAELITFIQAYEEYLGEKFYSKKRDLFGVEVEVKLNPGHVIANVAKTIKTVRNALVHSSDRHERSARHVPFSKSSEIVEREVPLVKFLAEKIITATASNRSG